MGPGDYSAWQDRMPTFDLDAYVARSGALDLDAIPWDEVARHPLPPQAARTLRYMQDIESHTIIYLRSLLATRAVDDPDVATFLACDRGGPAPRQAQGEDHRRVLSTNRRGRPQLQYPPLARGRGRAGLSSGRRRVDGLPAAPGSAALRGLFRHREDRADRKSTRLNSSH